MNLSRLAAEHTLTGAQIRNAVLHAALAAASAPPGERVITHQALDRAARDQHGAPVDLPVASAVGSA